MPNQLTVSVVIPVYRAEQTLVDLHRQLCDAMAKLTPFLKSSSSKMVAAMVPGRSLKASLARTSGCAASA